MGMRTVVAFSHGEATAIERDPEGFVRAVMHMLNSGVTDSPDEHDRLHQRNLEHYGVTVSPTYPSSSRAEVVVSSEGGDLVYHRQRF